MGHTIIIWTCREGERLLEAVNWLLAHDIPFDYVNQNDPDRTARYNNDSRKVGADVYIDDKSAGRWSWREIIEEARALTPTCPKCGSTEIDENDVCLKCGYCLKDDGSGHQETKVETATVDGGWKPFTIPGVGPDAPTVVNEHGGKGSRLPVRMSLIPPKVLLALGEVFTYGANKYGDDNWRKLSTREHLDHCMLHVLAYQAGDTQDEHLKHALTRLSMALAQEIDPTEDTPHD